jgi:glycolate oxidase FAD binding subunit
VVDADALAKRLEEVVGADALTSAETEACAVDGVRPGLVATPADADQVAALLKVADGADAKVIPWGGGTNQGLGNPPERADLVLRTARLSRLIAHEPADMTCVAGAGIRLADLQAALGEAGQFLPLDPPDPETATLGGVLSASASGPLRLAYGWPRDAVIGTQVALVSGQQARAGGRVVKNVAGFDLNKLYVGALGTLGVLVEVALKVLPLPERRASVAAVFPDLNRAAGAVRSTLQTDLLPCALELISPRAAARLASAVPLPSGGFVLLVRAEGVPEAVQDQRERLKDLFHTSGAVSIAPFDGPEEPALWDAVRQFRRAPETARRTVRCRVSVPIRCVRAVFDAADALRGQREVACDLVAHAGSGIVLCYLDLESPDRVDRAVAAAADLRQRASELDGHLVVESAPPAFKARLDVWGKWGPDLRLMRALKAQYDPKRTLNPGRFVGGI